VAEFGRLDMVVCCAGGGHGHIRRFDWAQWQELYQLNVLSALGVVHACLAPMKAQRWGRLILVGSTAGRDADPRFAGYGAAKAALAHASKALALAYARDNILANCVLPGLTRTDGVVRGYIAEAERLGTTAEAVEQRMMELQPIALGRAGESEEVASAITFLCSERASWITGAELLVDGGTIRVTP
jgi:NAD(P)-dependent dehydrogenase (short-subunit alcohol dehydrogenase family)